jgi:hypothetical protein
MSIGAINPISSGLVIGTAAVTASASRKAAPASAAAAAAPSPAATVTLSGPPASVDADDRAMYSQVLRAASGNVNAAMAAVARQDTAGGES